MTNYYIEKLSTGDTPPDDDSIFNSPLKIGLIIGGSLLVLIIMLIIAANYA